MKEDKNIFSIKHICNACDKEMELSSTDEIETEEMGNISILIYQCDNCDTRVDIIDSDKVYLNQVGNYVLNNVITNS